MGDGVSIDLIENPLGVRAGLELSLPPASVGVFSLKNIAFSAGLTNAMLEEAIVDLPPDTGKKGIDWVPAIVRIPLAAGAVAAAVAGAILLAAGLIIRVFGGPARRV